MLHIPIGKILRPSPCPLEACNLEQGTDTSSWSMSRSAKRTEKTAPTSLGLEGWGRVIAQWIKLLLVILASHIGNAWLLCF